MMLYQVKKNVSLPQFLLIEILLKWNQRLIKRVGSSDTCKVLAMERHALVSDEYCQEQWMLKLCFSLVQYINVSPAIKVPVVCLSVSPLAFQSLTENYWSMDQGSGVPAISQCLIVAPRDKGSPHKSWQCQAGICALNTCALHLILAGFQLNCQF